MEDLVFSCLNGLPIVKVYTFFRGNQSHFLIGTIGNNLGIQWTPAGCEKVGRPFLFFILFIRLIEDRRFISNSYRNRSITYSLGCSSVCGLVALLGYLL